MSSSKPVPGATERWSDGETSALIDAWGPLYLQRARGSLSLKEWRLVSGAANAHHADAGNCFNRSRAQCQRRVYTLKDRYNRELLKQRPSRWRHFSQLHAFLASPDGPPPGFPAKTPAPVKEDEVVGGVSGSILWSPIPKRRRFSSLQSIQASLHGPSPPGFPARMPASVKDEEEVIGGGRGSAWDFPAAVVTKLAAVYERVDIARLDVEKEKMEIERKKVAAAKVDNLEETDNHRLAGFQSANDDEQMQPEK